MSLVINAAFGMLSAAAQGVGGLVVMRLIAGIGVGGSVPVVFSFLAELLPATARWEMYYPITEAGHMITIA